MKATANRRGLAKKPDLSVIGLIREIIRLVEGGKRNKDQLQAFVEGRNPFEVASPLNIDGAITILGESKVITAEQACAAWGYGTPAIEIPIRYTEETLRECAVLNRSGQAD